jgi:hypothetical protein
LAGSLGPRGIRINALLPASREGATAPAVEIAAVQRLAPSDDIGAAVVDIVSHESGAIKRNAQGDATPARTGA